MTRLNFIFSVIILLVSCNSNSTISSKEIGLNDTLEAAMKLILRDEIFVNIYNTHDTLENNDSLKFNITNIYNRGKDSSEYCFNYEYNNSRYCPIPIYFDCLGLINKKVRYINTGNYKLHTFKNSATARLFFVEKFKGHPEFLKLLE